MTVRDAASHVRPPPGSMTMTGTQFLRFIRGMRLTDPPSELRHHHIDIIFSKSVPPGARRMDYQQFIQRAMPLLCETMFPGLPAEDAARLAIREIVINAPHDHPVVSPRLKLRMSQYDADHLDPDALRQNLGSPNTRGVKGPGYVPARRTVHGFTDLATTLRN